MNILNLFPTPVGKFKIERDFTEKESNFFERQPMYKNMGNMTSDERYVLTHKTMSSIKKFVEQCVGNYFNTIYSPKNNVSLRITQSWLNYSKSGEWHHKHAHPNSLVSGVLYMKALKDSDKIYFYNDSYKQINIPVKEFNPYNSTSWWLPVETGDLMLFPSSLTHSVEPVQGAHTRISLAFNTFPVGYVGEDKELTALHLRD